MMTAVVGWCYVKQLCVDCLISLEINCLFCLKNITTTSDGIQVVCRLKMDDMSSSTGCHIFHKDDSFRSRTYFYYMGSHVAITATLYELCLVFVFVFKALLFSISLGRINACGMYHNYLTSAGCMLVVLLCFT